VGNNDQLQTPDSVGVPLPGVSIKIINPDAKGIGEICVRGPMIMMGYYEDEVATREVLDEEGWLKTGDLGFCDADGNYRITGRIKNVIVTKNGKNIYPEEVEFYLNKHPLINESMVFGSEEMGSDEDTRVVANIFPDFDAIMEKLKQKNLTKEDIHHAVEDAVKEINRRLPLYKRVKQLHVRDTEFIKTTTQKIKRYANLEKESKDK
jgi:long-chain acyl-CoA synthetase